MRKEGATGRTGKGGQQEQKVQPQETHRPYFIGLVTVIDIALLIYEIVYNGGFEPFTYNPWLGPSTETLVDVGAKFVPKILEGEWWRFLTPIFLHVGIAHIFMNLLMQLKVGISLEKSYGAMRIAPIYVLCGMYGNILSSIFLPTQVQVGASGALFGFLGVLLSDLLQNWSLLQTPWRNLISLLITIIISLAIGLLPGVDNFAHVGGFVMGILTGFVFLPNLSYGKCQARWRTCVVCTFIPVVVVLFLVSWIAFYAGVDANGWCGWCSQISCLDVLDWCNGISITPP